MDEAKNNQSNYDIPLWKRNLAEEKQHSEKTKIFLENIEKYREKVSQLTAQVKLLDELSNIPSIANIQIQVKTDCKECLEKERKILQLKIEKEKEKIAYEQLLITREKDLKKLEIEGRTDSLTKLNNRKKFEQDLHNLVQSGREFSVAVIDIDYFKKINDTY
jgi:predicted signal transduction protein with EAL and GGDEF domain